MFVIRHPGRRAVGRRGLIAVVAGTVLAWTTTPAATGADAPVEVADRMALREALVAAYGATPVHLERFRLEDHGHPDVTPVEFEVFLEGALVAILVEEVSGTVVPAGAAPWTRGVLQAGDAETSVTVAEGRVALSVPGPAAMQRAEAPFDAAREAVRRRCETVVPMRAAARVSMEVRVAPDDDGRFDVDVRSITSRSAEPSWLDEAAFREADEVRATADAVTVVRGPLETTLRRADGSLAGLRCTHPRDPSRVAVLTRVAPAYAPAAWRSAIAAAQRLPDAPDAAGLRTRALEVVRETAFEATWAAVAGEAGLRLRTDGPCRVAIVEELARALAAYGADEPGLPRASTDLAAVVARTLRRQGGLDDAASAAVRKAFAATFRGAGGPATVDQPPVR